jgi:hypothetical protein
MLVGLMFQLCFVTAFRLRGVEKGNDQLTDKTWSIRFLYKLECY